MSFIRFDNEDIVVSAESITSALWTGNINTLTSIFTSDTQKASTSGQYYLNVYQLDPDSPSAEIQFSIAYADKVGSGSIPYNSDPNLSRYSPSSTIFGQYRTLVLGDEDTDFTFGEKTSEYFYAITIDRARYKEKLLPGTLTLKLSTPSGTVVLTDNSNQISTITYTDSGRVYELITGSLGILSEGKLHSQGYTSGSNSYGKFLPDIGVILLNGAALDEPVEQGGINLGTNRNPGVNVNNVLMYDTINSGSYFRLNSEETITSNLIFLRARNSQLNYSTNPSLITGSGEIRHDVMINSPQVYFTTIGLYNDNNDLLAVAKMSRPLLKDFTKEALVRVKLNY